MAANLKEVRERIRSVMNIQQITKAMKMVSASKLRRAQQAVTQLRPYSEKLDQMLRNILSNLDGDVQTSFGVERPVQRACLVVVTSNRGLAGAFNTNVIKAALRTMEAEMAQPMAAGQLDVILIGKRGYDFFRRRYTDKVNIIADYVTLFDDLSFDNTQQVAQRIMDAFEAGEYDLVHVAYAHFRNAAIQDSVSEQFLPVPKIEPKSNQADIKADYIFEPDQETLLTHLIPSILQTQFHKFLLDTHASEHGARMTAMDKATENANELLRDLRISYNRARQESITNEILEIVGGAAALETE